MNMKPTISPEEKKWRARSDARTLAEAEEIKADKERHKLAIEGAKEIAHEEIARVKGVMKVANTKGPKIDDVPNDGSNPPIFDKRGYKNPATIGRF